MLPSLFSTLSIIFKDICIPEIRRQPLVVLNPLKILLGIGLLFLGIICSLVFAVMIGKQTARVGYNHGWRAWSAPFKLAGAYTFNQYADGRSQNDYMESIIDVSEKERYKRSEATIAAHAIKTNNIIKNNIEEFPIEISSIISVYATEEYKEYYGDEYYRKEIVIEKNDAAIIAEKNLSEHINQSHASKPTSWSARFFSCLGRYRNLNYHSAEKAGYEYKKL